MSYRGMLMLEEIEVADGIMYLYPEFADNPDRFDLGAMAVKPIQKIGDFSTRQILYIEPIGNSEPFVAKEERAANDYYRKENRMESINLSLREISIARALQLISYEDAKRRILFEKPIGYYETKDGKRTAFFEFNRELEKKALNTEKLTGKDELRNGYEKLFANIILLVNGILHNEVYENLKFGEVYGDPETGKSTTFVFDFELCKILDKSKVESNIDWWLYGFGTVGPTSNYFILNRDEIMDMPCHERREIFLSGVKDKGVCSEVKRILEPTGYFSGNMTGFGPAYEIIKDIGRKN